MRFFVHFPIAVLLLLVGVGAWILWRDPPPLPTFAAPADEPGPAPPRLDLGPETLAGTLLGPTGDPIAGASLFTERGPRPIWATSAKDGRFELPGLDAGPVEVSVLARGHPTSVHRLEVGAGPVELRLPEALRPVTELPKPEASDLSGYMDYRLGGPDKSAYELYLEPLTPPDRIGGPLPRRLRLNPDGSFNVERLIHGRYRVLVLPPHAIGALSPDLLCDLQESAPILIDHDSGSPELQLLSIAGALTGRALTREERPRALEGALIRVEPLGPPGGGGDAPRSFPAITTAADGSWRIDDLPPGIYLLRLSAGSEGRSATVTVKPSNVGTQNL